MLTTVIISFLTSIPALEEKKALKIREEEHTERYGVMIYCLCHIFLLREKYLLSLDPPLLCSFLCTQAISVNLGCFRFRATSGFYLHTNTWDKGGIWLYVQIRRCTHPNRMTQYYRVLDFPLLHHIACNWLVKCRTSSVEWAFKSIARTNQGGGSKVKVNFR